MKHKGVLRLRGAARPYAQHERKKTTPVRGESFDRLRTGSAKAESNRDDELLARAAKVRLLLLDVDGVLTDGRLYYGADGEVMKAYDVKDGHGLVLLRDHVQLGVISGRPGLSRKRLEDLRFQHMLFSQRDKLEGYAQLGHLGFADDEVAYMGDDVNDLGLLRKVGLSACPADAHPAVRAAVHLVTAAPGGRGAVRELVELILRAKGLWQY